MVMFKPPWRTFFSVRRRSGPAGSGLLLEDGGGYLLLEDGTYLLLE